MPAAPPEPKVAGGQVAKDHLAALGQNLVWAFPVPASGNFGDLLEALDHAEKTPARK
jgi:hypothetical protein